jgi:crotonobetainyl-CoA:carnitine CoA-transferase CaiB-like acyl-CoA transferase
MASYWLHRFSVRTQFVVATLLALYHRGRTGNGQFCTASLLGGAMQSMSEAFLLPDGKVSPVAQLDANQTGNFTI